MLVKRFVALLLVAWVVPFLGVLDALDDAAQAADSRSDIVLVLTDDMTESDWSALPETTRLLPSVFPNYVNTNPLCCPSRASILRGQYSHTHGTLHNRNSATGGWESFRDQEHATIAVLLQEAGYRTGLIGKYLNGYSADAGTPPPGWDYWIAQVRLGYFNWQALERTGGEGTAIVSYGEAEHDYSTDVFARKAASFVATTPADQPLFLAVWPEAPHGPRIVAPRHRGTCTEPLRAASKSSFREADMADKPEYLNGKRERKLTIDSLTGDDRDRRCTLKAVDELVVTLAGELTARGRPFTIVLATDNGFLLGEHRWEGKAVPYEESIRTPMRAVGPDFPAGVDPRLVANIDLAPTFAAIADVPPPR